MRLPLAVAAALLAVPGAHAFASIQKGDSPHDEITSVAAQAGWPEAAVEALQAAVRQPDIDDLQEVEDGDGSERLDASVTYRPWHHCSRQPPGTDGDAFADTVAYVHEQRGLAENLSLLDPAAAVRVTTVNSLLAAVTTPLLFLGMTRLLLGDAASIQVSVLEMVGLVLAIVVVPIVLGLLLRRARPRLALRAERPFRIASSILLVLVVALAVYQNRVGFWGLAASAVPISLALNVLALAGGLAVGKLAGLGDFQARAVSIEAGFQNGTLGIALAVAQLDDAVAALVPGFYSLTMFATGAAVAWWWARDARRKGPAASAGPGP